MYAPNRSPRSSKVLIAAFNLKILRYRIFAAKVAYAEARQISLLLAATQLPRAKACRSLNLSFDQALDTRQKLVRRFGNPASQHAKIAAVIAQKLQNIVSDGLRALAQKQLLQKGENFALMRQRAAVAGIKVKPGHNRSEAFSASSSPRKTAGLWRRFAVSLQIYLSGAQYRAKVRKSRRPATAFTASQGKTRRYKRHPLYLAVGSARSPFAPFIRPCLHPTQGSSYHRRR